MRILIACDKFKGSLKSNEVNLHISNGISGILKDAKISTVEVADGGDGSLLILSELYEAEMYPIEVQDASGHPIKSFIGYNRVTKTAILEMASYVGLDQLPQHLRNPLETSSLGLGQAINSAIELGAKKLIIGIGGSATNDGGSGMLEALGFKFYDQSDNQVIPNGGNIGRIERIEFPSSLSTNGIEIIIASDVQNPITGPNGATLIYAEQKGARKKDLEFLESNMDHFVRHVESATKREAFGIAGYGAAGGIPLSACTFLNAKLISGSQLIFDLLEIEKRIDDADLIITGEGKIDDQTSEGKAITPIIDRVIASGKGLILVCGIFDSSDEQLSKVKRFELLDLAQILDKNSFSDAKQLCEEVGKQIGLSLKKEGIFHKGSLQK